MKVLLVHAHHEPKSFSSALFRQAERTLAEIGHEVVTSDLYRQGFDPVSDRRNFRSVRDPGFLKQQAEEQHATEVDGFAPELDAEIRKLEACDLLVFSFPLWWFGMPAILKGWVDRAFPMGRIYGGETFYENGLGKARRRGMVLMTTGGGPDAYDGFGVNPPLDHILSPIHHGVFWFNGFLPLDPFVAWGPARISAEERVGYLERLDERLRRIDEEPPIRLPLLGDFPGFGKDRKTRFMVTVTRKGPPDERYLSLVPADTRRLAELKRSGIVQSAYMGSPEADPWRGFLMLRESRVEQARRHLDSLPLAPFHEFEVTELLAS